MGLRDELTGRTVGEFVLRERIGEGGFGAVYRCEQPLLGREAVVKVLHNRLRASEVMIQRFLREARLASRVDHPYAAHVYAFGAEKDGLLWIAMEMVHGIPLDRWLRDRGPMPLPELVPFFERLAEVVHTLHESGIVHRDLKPSNVMVIERAGRQLPKLLDLGIAKLLAGEVPVRKPAGRVSSSIAIADTLRPLQSEIATLTASAEPPTTAPLDAALTDAGAAMGSPAYMSPEQWTETDVGPHSDLYALGIVAFEAIAGRRPFSAQTAIGFAELHANAPIPTVGGELPPALDRLFARALAKQPGQRFHTALELASALRVASGLVESSIDLPKLDRDVHDAWIANAPQPLAEAVAALDAARNPHQGRDAAREVWRGLVRYLLVLALAAHAQVRDDRDDKTLRDLLRALRLRDVDDDERVNLLRRVVSSFVSRRTAHPLPPLVDLLTPRPDGAGDALEPILALGTTSDPRGLADDLLRSQLGLLVVELGRALRAASFVLDHPLIVLRGGSPERWMGLRRAKRPLAIVREITPVADQPLLVDQAGRPVLLLWPLVQVLDPTPGAGAELFVFDGRGRHGARLVAAPTGFERHDETVWDWLGDHVLTWTNDDAAAAHEEQPPYLGLAAFTSSDAERFVGRERDTDAFVNRLRLGALQIVVGASGAGKSSFVHAGVIPALAGWRATTLRPGAAPLAALAARLAAIGVGVDVSLLTDDPTAAAALVVDAAGDGGIVIVVDQLEELFTLCLDDGERLRFATALAALAGTTDHAVRVICTVRDDFLMRVESLPPLARRMSAAVFLLGNPSRDDLVRTIVDPARRCGYELSDAALAFEMADAVAGRPGALALLSFTASRLWELRDRRFHQLTRKAYDAMGGVGGALSRHADEMFDGLTSDEQRLVRAAFRRLVTSEGTRSQLSLAELREALGGDRVENAIDKLIGARLLVTIDSDDGPRIEVAHEALLAAWPRAQQWLREDADSARIRDQLLSAARQWNDRGRPRGALWRDDALAELEHWRARSDAQELTAIELAFATASRVDATRSRRTRRIAAVTAFCVLAAALIVLLWSNRRTREARARAEAMASEEHVRATEQLVEQGRELLLQSDAPHALVYLTEAKRRGADGFALDFMIDEAVAPIAARIHAFIGHEGRLRSAEFSRDGSLIVTASNDGTARVWDTRTGRQRAVVGDHGAPIWSAHFDPSGRRILTASHNGTAAIYDVDGVFVRSFRDSNEELHLAQWSPDGKLVALAGNGAAVSVWNADTGTRLAALAVKPILGGLKFSRDSQRIIIASDASLETWTVDGRLLGRFSEPDLTLASFDTSDDDKLAVVMSLTGFGLVIDLRSGRTISRLEGHSGRGTGVAISADGGTIVTTSSDRTARVWNGTRGELRCVLTGHSGALRSAALDGSGTRIVTAGADGSARVWDAASCAQLALLQGHRASVETAMFAPDGATIVTASFDGTAAIWRARTRPLVAVLGDERDVTAAHFSPDGSRLLVYGENAVARIYVLGGGPPIELRGHGGSIEAAEWSPDGTLIVTASDDGTARIWDRDGRERVVLTGHRGEVWQATFAPDGNTIATAGADATVRTWSVDGVAQWTARGPEGQITVLKFSHDGRWLVTGSNAQQAMLHDRDGHVRQLAPVKRVWAATFSPDSTKVALAEEQSASVWDVASATRMFSLPHDGIVESIHFDRDGRRIVTGSEDSVARIWDLATRKATRLEGHADIVFGAVFDPKERFLATASADRTIRIWDAAHARTIAVLNGHSVAVYQLELSPDGASLASVGLDRKVMVWNLTTIQRDLDELDHLLRCRVGARLVGTTIEQAAPEACD